MYPDNTTQQVMHCKCPHNSVAYLIKRHAYQSVSGTGYQYSFACSPQTVSFYIHLSTYLHILLKRMLGFSALNNLVFRVKYIILISLSLLFFAEIEVSEERAL